MAGPGERRRTLQPIALALGGLALALGGTYALDPIVPPLATALVLGAGLAAAALGGIRLAAAPLAPPARTPPPASSPAPPAARAGAALVRAALLLAVPLLLAASDALLAAFPVTLQVAAAPTRAEVQIDGRRAVVPLERPLSSVAIPPADRQRREILSDGSETITIGNYRPEAVARLAAAPFYRLQSWLRDEPAYSAWRNLTVWNEAGAVLMALADPTGWDELELPPRFTLRAELYRPEITRALDLRDDAGAALRVEVSRADKSLRLLRVLPGVPPAEIERWYFPTRWEPFAAELGYLALRSLAAALALVALVTLTAAFLPARPLRPPAWLVGAAGPALAVAAVGALGSWWTAALWDKAPQVLDSIAISVQAKTLAAGRLWAPAPPVPEAFPTPFMVTREGRWFAQYPPGAALLLAGGLWLEMPWLVGPLLAAATALLAYLLARRQYGAGTAALAVLLLASSPWLHLISSSFLSHAPALFWATLALYATARYRETLQPAAPEQPGGRSGAAPAWAALAAAGLGGALLTREVVALLYGLPLAAWAAVRAARARPPLGRLLRDVGAAGAVLGAFVGAYLLYNAALTGSPLLLPRHLFNPADRLGFGPGLGWYGQHTVAAGLANADILLTALNVYLFGWPFYTAFALIALPLLFRPPAAAPSAGGAARSGPLAVARGPQRDPSRAGGPARRLVGGVDELDLLAALIAFGFVAIYTAYFYHGVIFGPRYYFEVLVPLALLAARGLATLAATAARLLRQFGRAGADARAWSAVALLTGALLLGNLLCFLPRQVELYQGTGTWSGGRGPALGAFVGRTRLGRVVDLPNALVTTTDTWTYQLHFAALNCPLLDCAVVFAKLPDRAGARAALRSTFAGRDWYEVRERDGRLEIEPVPAAAGETTGQPAVAPVHWPVTPAQTALRLPFDGTLLGLGGERPDEGDADLVPGVAGGQAVQLARSGLTYRGVALAARQGALGLWVQPLWDGDDGATHVLLEGGAGPARVRLVKDGANNLRFIVWTDGRESNVGYGVPWWRRGAWLHVVGTWEGSPGGPGPPEPGGRLRLYVDGELVGETAGVLPSRFAPELRLGFAGDFPSLCRCVLDEVIVAREPVAPGRSDR